MKRYNGNLKTLNAADAQRIKAVLSKADDDTSAAAACISIDVNSVPPHVRDNLSRFVLALTKEYFTRPGVEEQYQTWLKERRKRMAAQNLNKA